VSDSCVDIIDFSPYRSDDNTARARVVDQIDRACQEIGFLKLTGHDIPLDLLDEVRSVTRRFFALPDSDKRAWVHEPRHPNRGYAPMGGEALGATSGDTSGRPDLFEAFTIGPIDRPRDAYHTSPQAGRFFDANLFPSTPDNFGAVWVDYYRCCQRLADDVMSAFAQALGLDVGFFIPYTDRHITAMRALHYPVLTVPPQKDQYRIGPHTDFGSLTLLIADDTPGLQVHRDDGWDDVTIEPGVVLVNIGDLMADWTNGRWRSTLHRVMPSAPDRDRLSITFFHHPNYDAVISALPRPVKAPVDEPLRPPVTAGEYLSDKLRKLTLSSASYPATD
jgi:isopenicillin N synthase-like dioxygenase